MNLFDTKMIIKRWVQSTDRAEQADLLIPFIMNFIQPKFQNDPDITETVNELLKGIEIRKKILADPDLHPAQKFNYIDNPSGGNHMEEMT